MSSTGVTEKAAGGRPALQVSHICGYAASRLRVNRAVSKSGMVDRFCASRLPQRGEQIGLCRQPQRQAS